MNENDIREKILTDDRWLCRALYRVWENQTDDERRDEETKHHNGVGFNGCDGPILTSFGNRLHRCCGGERRLLTGRELSPKQIAVARKCMPKYIRQLVE
jgi:hypothetical protein